MQPVASSRASTTASAIEETSSTHRNPFATPGRESPENPFATPIRPPHTRAASAISGEPLGPRRRFKSSRLKGEFEKPWLNTGKRIIDWDRIIFYSCIAIGLGIGAFLCWKETTGVPNHDYCLIMDDDFQNLDNWNHEVQMNGFGTGAFDWTTDDKANSYVDEQGLHIVPTLTLESTDITADQLVNGFTVNMTTESGRERWGSCTAKESRRSHRSSKGDGSDSDSDEDSDGEEKDEEDHGMRPNDASRWACAARSNATEGQIINPVRSARLNTKGKKSIRYGRVEVTARMPRGDWLWPAIWMMPSDNVYGEWPLSGEIDIAESRGNDARSYDMGDNLVSSALHWGTASLNDRWRLSWGEWGNKRKRFTQDTHVYGLEWSEKYLFTWLDGRLRQVFFFDFTKNKNLWSYGEFASESINGSVPVDPWGSTGRANTPFDQDFYLILNVAVGGTNGWFPDAVGGKPWADGSETPMQDFWKANSTWLPSWGPEETRGMIVKSVKMWQQGKCSESSS